MDVRTKARSGVGIGWIDCGPARGDEVLVVEAKG